MYTSLVGIFSALILFWLSCVASGNVQNYCSKVLTNTCKLRWSHERQEVYVVSSDNNKDDRDSHTITGNRSVDGNTLCISNSERQTVHIQFDVQVAATTSKFQNCPDFHSTHCKSVCVAVDTSKETYVINDKSVNVNYVKVALPNDSKTFNKTITATSNPHEQKTIYPDLISDNSVTGSPSSSQRQLSDRRRRAKRKCGKRCRGRRLMFKKIANDFLLEFAKQARKLPVSNYSSLTRLLRHSSKLSSQINKLRSYDVHHKRATLTYPPYSKYSGISYGSSKSDGSNSKDEKRFKRDPENGRPTSPGLHFCGAISYLESGYLNRAKSTELPSQALDQFSGRWTAPSFPFILSSRAADTILDIAKILTLDHSVLERLEISIQFLPVAKAAWKEADPQLIADVPPTSVNASSLPFISDNITLPYGNNVEIAAAAIGGGLGLLFVTVMILLLCMQKGKCSWFARSKTQRCECPSISESERCLSATETVNDKPTVSCSDGTGWNEPDSIFVADNNIITLEVKKSKREKNKARTSSKPSLSNEKSPNKASNHLPCQHTAAIRGSSRHDHCCIVCELAGKPHKPIMSAQHYASQVLNSTERHTQGAVDATVKSKSMMRDGRGNDSNPSTNSTSSLPWTVHLPDGEGRLRGGQGTEGSLMSDRRTFRVCIKPPPNRTIYSCDALPFNNNAIKKSPTPPSIPPKSHKRVEHSPSSRLPPGYSSDISNGSNNSRTGIRGNGCVWRYLMSHIDDPPPDYSDVVS